MKFTYLREESESWAPVTAITNVFFRWLFCTEITKGLDLADFICLTCVYTAMMKRPNFCSASGYYSNCTS